MLKDPNAFTVRMNADNMHEVRMAAARRGVPVSVWVAMVAADKAFAENEIAFQDEAIQRGYR